jgi:hypothetical protein
MTANLDIVEVGKYLVSLIAYMAVLGYTVHTLKKSVNGIGGKLRKVELSLARLEGAMGVHPISEVKNDPKKNDQ